MRATHHNILRLVRFTHPISVENCRPEATEAIVPLKDEGRSTRFDIDKSPTATLAKAARSAWMPPEARLAGLILLLVCPAGLVAQTESLHGIRHFSQDRPARKLDQQWEIAPQSASPSPASPLSERSPLAATLASRTRQRGSSPAAGARNTAESPVNGHDSPKDGVAPASYLAPEVLTGNSDETDARADVYSLGAILYEIIALQPPFVGDGPEEIIRKAVHNRVISPEVPAQYVGSRAPQGLSTICQRALNKAPLRRYRNAGELRDEVKEFMANAFFMSL